MKKNFATKAQRHKGKIFLITFVSLCLSGKIKKEKHE